MITKQRAIVVILFVITGLFTAIKAGSADEYIPPPNWWFRQAYTVDEAALPENLTFINTRYEESALGKLVFRNDGDLPVYILKLSSPIPATEFRKGTRLEAGFIREHSFKLPDHQATTIPADHVLYASQFNTDGEGEITQEPPSPFETRLVMFVDRVVHIVPVTVTYSINPEYLVDPDPPVPTPTFAEKVDRVHFIVDGVVHGPPDIHPDLWDGIFEVTVHRWFKGEGPANIQVLFEPIIEDGGFWNPPFEKRVILYLRQPVAENFPYRYFDYETLYRPAVSELIAAIGHEPFTPPGLEGVSTTVENTAVSKPTGLWLGLGVAGGALGAVVVLLIVRRRRPRLA